MTVDNGKVILDVYSKCKTSEDVQRALKHYAPLVF